MRKPVNNQFGTRITVDKHMKSYMNPEDLERYINREAVHNLAQHIMDSQKFKMKNITQEEIEAYKNLGGVPITGNHIVDDYYGAGIEYYEGRVFVFTTQELNDYINEVIHIERERTLSILVKAASSLEE